MTGLRAKMAEYGFESNDDYEYALRCLLRGRHPGIRCLNVEGAPGRRKTAFATALARALEFPRVLYFDHSQQHPPPPDLILPPSRDEQGREEPPIDPFDQVMSEACAFSEGEDCILILDQLQSADFREHIRLCRFLQEARWAFRQAEYFANPRHLVVFLISEEPLYHSLQRLAFRVWVERVSRRPVHFPPQVLGLPPEAAPLLSALEDLFEHLDTGPTATEMGLLMDDIHRFTRNTDDLRRSLYGRIEGLDWALLQDPANEPLVTGVMEALRGYLGEVGQEG